METLQDEHQITTLGCLLASGADAGSFLQGQLSADLVSLEPGQLSISGWHNPKGRVRCLLWVGPEDTDSWRMVTETTQLEALATGLQRYILRSKVQLTRETDAKVWLQSGAEDIPQGGINRWVLPGSGDTALCAGPEWTASTKTNFLPSSELVSSGVPRLGLDLADQFLGSSLNLDLIGGISFSKGCFPGQEVLARTHNLGKVKRRLLKFAAGASTPEPGDLLTNADGERCGQVVSRNGQGEFLASVQLRWLAQPMFLSNSDIALQVAPLPYSVPELREYQP